MLEENENSSDYSNSHLTPQQPPTSLNQPSSPDSTRKRPTNKVIYITTNVGSICEKLGKGSDTRLKNYLHQIEEKIKNENIAMVAIHFQELGGKKAQDTLHCLDKILKDLMGLMLKYDLGNQLVVADQDYTCVKGEGETEYPKDMKDTFTSLGCAYFCHSNLKAEVYNFSESSFEHLRGRNIYTGDLSNCPVVSKHKFNTDCFINGKVSRKGFIFSYWRLKHVTYTLVNVHMIADVDNTTCLDTDENDPLNSPTAKLRKKGLDQLLKTLDEYEHCIHPEATKRKTPCFIFGDYNFRLSMRGFFERQFPGIVFEKVDGKVTATQKGKIIFEMTKDTFIPKVFIEMHEPLPFDREAMSLCKEGFGEKAILFKPSYCIAKLVDGLDVYSNKRLFAWTDRVMYSTDCEKYFSILSYDMLDQNVETADHKTIFFTAIIRNRSLKDRLIKFTNKSEQASTDNEPIINYTTVIVNGIKVRGDWNVLFNGKYGRPDRLPESCKDLLAS